MTVLGVDAYARGWVAVAVEPDRAAVVMSGRELEQLIDGVPGARCVAIDMPIGLPDRTRPADQHAKDFIRPRHNSVFPVPPREVLYAHTYKEANRLATELLGKKISKQTYALAKNVRAVETLAEQDPRLIEIHPEVAFRALIGEPIQWAKTSWNGQEIRRRHLASAGIALPDALEEAGVVSVADVLDAAVAAWSARRYAAHGDGSKRCLIRCQRPGSSATSLDER